MDRKNQNINKILGFSWKETKENDTEDIEIIVFDGNFDEHK